MADQTAPPPILSPLGRELADKFTDYCEHRSGCECHISPPCGCCTHPGNPLNLEETDDAWEPEGSKVFQFERDVTGCEGSQSFQVIALNPADALKRANAGKSFMISSDADVTDLSDVELSDFYEVDEREEML